MDHQELEKQVCVVPLPRNWLSASRTGEQDEEQFEGNMLKFMYPSLHPRYSHGKLVEINSHSLFSKWFSESGKLVQKLFARVTEMVEDESGFVVVLIGEFPPRQHLVAAQANRVLRKQTKLKA
jgi:hypothetical protein